MPRLADPDPASIPEEVREFLASLPPDPMVKKLSHSAGTVKPFVQLAKAQFTALELPTRSRELVILTVAEYTASAFVTAQHDPMALAAGVGERTRQLVRDRQLDSPEFSPADRALICLTAEVVQRPRVSDEIFQQAREFLTDRELLEALQVAGYYWTFGWITTVLDVEFTEVYGDEPQLDTPMTESGPDAAGGRRRKDALRNHERVVAAAAEAFRERGSGASVPQIAARARAGKATVYRSFPAKEDLLEAITRLSLDELRQRTAPALRETDAYEAFRRYVLELFDALARDRLLAERLSDTASAAAGSILETLAARMEKAQTSGKIRADASKLDLRVLLCGAALQLRRLGETDPVTWRRYGGMVLTSLRP